MAEINIATAWATESRFTGACKARSIVITVTIFTWVILTVINLITIPTSKTYVANTKMTCFISLTNPMPTACLLKAGIYCFAIWANKSTIALTPVSSTI